MPVYINYKFELKVPAHNLRNHNNQVNVPLPRTNVLKVKRRMELKPYLTLNSSQTSKKMKGLKGSKKAYKRSWRSRRDLLRQLCDYKTLSNVKTFPRKRSIVCRIIEKRSSKALHRTNKNIAFYTEARLNSRFFPNPMLSYLLFICNYIWTK